MWECRESKRIWQLFNEFATTTNQQEDRVLVYEDVFKIGNKAIINKTKVKTIQGMIQIERPKSWTLDNIMTINNEIKRIEIYNQKKSNNNIE